jgi:hypothetical protein
MFRIVFGVRNATCICASLKSFVILLVALALCVKIPCLVFSCCESSRFVMIVLVGMCHA